MRSVSILTGLGAMAMASSASAEVFQKSEVGFIIRQGADVSATTDEAWQQLTAPAKWWSSEHTYSGDAANLSIDPRAGGCFCELLPARESPRAAPRGSVEHMRVVYVERGRALRMSGALGPLQSEAVAATLTINLKPIDGGGTRILWEYVVGGYMRHSVEGMAPAVDAVLGEQVKNLAAKLGLKAAATPKPKEPAGPTEPGR